MLFHVGAIWRLVEAGYLKRLQTVSSVSGGAITAGVLAHKWSKLAPQSSAAVEQYKTEVVAPLRALASLTIDEGIVLKSAAAFWMRVGNPIPGNRLAKAYAKHLFGDAKLSDLPVRPRFVFNASSMQTGERFWFSRESLGDDKIGHINTPKDPLAAAVAASSAFPPVLSPLHLVLDHHAFEKGGYLCGTPEYRSKVALFDGGVFDNLGLDGVETEMPILVSDGGMGFEPHAKVLRNWISQVALTMDIIDNQVRNFRRKSLLESFKSKARSGAYWSASCHITEFSGANKEFRASCKPQYTAELAYIPTRLSTLMEMKQERLINWGYAVADASIRTHFDPDLPQPVGFPYPSTGVQPQAR